MVAAETTHWKAIRTFPRSNCPIQSLVEFQPDSNRNYTCKKRKPFQT